MRSRYNPVTYKFLFCLYKVWSDKFIISDPTHDHKHVRQDSLFCHSPVLDRWNRLAFPPALLCVWVSGSEADVGAGAAVLAGALAVWVGGSFTPSIAIRTVESSCSGMLPSSEEKGLGGFSRHISQLVLPEVTMRQEDTTVLLNQVIIVDLKKPKTQRA